MDLIPKLKYKNYFVTGQVFSKENENESSNSHKKFEELTA